MSTFATRSCSGVVLLALLAFGCAKQPPAEPPLTEEDAREFARKLETALASGDVKTIDRLYRVPELVLRCIRDLDLPDDDRQHLLAKANASAPHSGLGRDLIAEVQAGRRMTLLRVRIVDGRPRIIMRVVNERRSLNYHEISLARFPDGDIGIEDVHVIATGEKLSQSMRLSLLRYAVEKNHKLAERFAEYDRAYTDNSVQIDSFIRLASEQKYAEALKAYRYLPTQLQKDKFLLIVAMSAAGRIQDEAEYVRLVDAFRTTYPNDPAADLFLVDYYSSKKEHDAALAAIDRVDRSVGGDPYLDFTRGAVLTQAGRDTEAKVVCERAIAADPKLEDAYWVRVSVATREQNHADTLAWLKTIVTVFGFELDPADMEKQAAYSNFVKSPQFAELKQWLAGRK